MGKGIKVRIDIVIIIVGIILTISNAVVNDYKEVYEEERARLFIQNMNNNVSNKKYSDYIAVLEIPKIGLVQRLFSPYSANNTQPLNSRHRQPRLPRSRHTDRLS